MDVRNEKTFFPYVYQLPKEEIKDRLDFIYRFIEMQGNECREQLENNRHVLDILYFGINFDKYFLRKLIFNKIKNDKLVEVEQSIRKFMLRDDVENYIKMESVFLLNSIGAKEPYTVNFDGEKRNVTIDSLGFPESEWETSWIKVKRKALSMMRNKYKRPYKKIVEDIWYEFIKSTFPELPEIDDVNIWAAHWNTLTVYAMRSRNISWRRYNISSASLLEKAEIINEAIKNKYQVRKKVKQDRSFMSANTNQDRRISLQEPLKCPQTLYWQFFISLCLHSVLCL